MYYCLGELWDYLRHIDVMCLSKPCVHTVAGMVCLCVNCANICVAEKGGRGLCCGIKRCSLCRCSLEKPVCVVGLLPGTHVIDW